MASSTNSTPKKSESESIIEFFNACSAVFLSISKCSLTAIACAVAVLGAIVVAALIHLYPANYLAEGERYHERKFRRWLHIVGYENVRYARVAVPEQKKGDFKCYAIAVFDTSDGPIAFTFQYEHLDHGWLQSSSRIKPLAMQDKDLKHPVIQRYLTCFDFDPSTVRYLGSESNQSKR